MVKLIDLMIENTWCNRKCFNFN